MTVSRRQLLSGEVRWEYAYEVVLLHKTLAYALQIVLSTARVVIYNF